jgi:hypothetical protein
MDNTQFQVDLDQLNAEGYTEDADAAAQALEAAKAREAQREAEATQQRQLQQADAAAQARGQTPAEASETTGQDPNKQPQQAPGNEAAPPNQGQNLRKAKEMSPDDPRMKDGNPEVNLSDPEEIGAELKAAIAGGGIDTASSWVTWPERMKDMFSGEMARQQDTVGYYTPKVDPFGEKKPITKTWWGGFVRGGVHFASMAASLYYGARLLARSPMGRSKGATSVLNWATGASKGVTKRGIALRGGVAGIASDVVSEESHEHNATGALVKRFPWLDNPLATKDTNDPAMFFFKNVTEGFGIGEVSEMVMLLIGKKSRGEMMTALANTGEQIKRAFTKQDAKPEAQLVADAIVDVDRQILEVRAIEKAKKQLDDNLTKEAAADYFRRTNGKGDLMKLNEIDRELLKYQYAKGKKRYQEWSSYQESAIDRSVRKIEEGEANIDGQITDAGVQQLDSPEPGGYKNKPVMDSWQGSPTQTANTVLDGLMAQRRLLNSWDPSQGSLPSMTTPASIKRSQIVVDVKGKELDDAYKQLLGESKFRSILEELKREGIEPRRFLAEQYESFMKMQEGRNTSDLTLDEYYAEIEAQHKASTGELSDGDSYEFWSMKNVVLTDLLNASNFKIMRDMGVVGREMQEIGDVFDIDGPVKVIADRLAYGIYNVKRSRMLVSDMFRSLQGVKGASPKKKAFYDRLANLHSESREVVQNMIDIVRKSDNPELTKAMLEAFSMSDDIRNWEDLFEFFKVKAKGGEWGGKQYASMVLKEFQGTMIHSVLTGPKTPVRAIMGTGTASFMRPVAQATGGLMQGDGRQIRLGLAGTSAYMEAIPEAFKLFFTNLKSYWAGDMATYKTKNFQFDKTNADWEAMGQLIAQRKKNGESVDGLEAAYNMGTIARTLNDQNLLTYNSKIMAAVDDTFGFLIARARAKQKAMIRAEELLKEGEITTVTPELMKAYETFFYDDLLDIDGNINFNKDSALNYARQEATLTRDLSGWAADITSVIEKNPWTRPFMLFSRTGVNGIELTFKHLPLFNRLVGDVKRINNATIEMAETGQLMDVGIETAEDLLAAQAVQKGRIAIGTGVVSMAGFAYMNGKLHGNGPQDRATRQLWIDSGWKPNSIEIGGVWINFNAFEPFGQILNYVADVGDAFKLMGPDWVERRYYALGLALTEATVSKSYIAGLKQLVDLIAAEDISQAPRIMANLMNNQIPLSSLRNEMGKVLNPYMKELNAGLISSIRNRNQISEYLTDEPLTPKFDMLDGSKINDWNFPTRMYNMISPVPLSLKSSPGRTLLWRSGYDLRITGYSTPGGINLKNAPAVRSMYQEAIGKQNIEKWLNKQADNPKMIESIERMEDLRRKGLINSINPFSSDGSYDKMDPLDFYHNKVIAEKFQEAQNKAWASIANNPEVKKLIRAKELEDAAAYNVTRGNDSLVEPQMDAAQKILDSTPTK